jgi:hypothetical protein
MLGERRRRRRRRRMQVSYRRQMLKATFMFWFKLEGMLPSIFFPPRLAGHFKNWACVGPYNYNLFFPLLYGNECPIPCFWKCPHFFHDSSWQVSQDKIEKEIAASLYAS